MYPICNKNFLKLLTEEETGDFRQKLSTKVKTNEGKPKPTEVQPVQKDFRSMLKKSVKTKTNEHFKTEQKDFRNQLKNKGKE